MLTVTLAESGRFGLQGVQVHHIQMRKPRHKHESGEKECDFGRIGTPLGSSTGSTDGGQCFFFQVVFLSPSLSKAKAQIPHIHDQILQNSSVYAISCSLPLHPMKYQCHQPYYWAAWRVGCYFGRAGPEHPGSDKIFRKGLIHHCHMSATGYDSAATFLPAVVEILRSSMQQILPSSSPTHTHASTLTGLTVYATRPL